MVRCRSGADRNATVETTVHMQYTKDENSKVSVMAIIAGVPMAADDKYACHESPVHPPVLAGNV
jgi:hypothetical protein